MRAPDEGPLFDPWKDYGTYSGADWRKIEKALAGVDLDATMVGNEHPEQDKVPLREALQDLANYYAARARLKPVLPRSERIDQLRQDEAAFEAARRATVYPMVKGALAAEIDRVRRERDQLEAQSGRDGKEWREGNENAKKLHRKFWGELLSVWLTLRMAPERRTHENLRAFLHACSAPIFPADTTLGALTAFTKDNYKPRRFRKRA